MRTLALAVLCTLWTSCLELEQVVTVRADGSGVQTLKLGMTERALASARAHAAVAQGASSQADPARIFDARLVRAEVTAAGLECKRVRTFAERRRRFVEVEAAFSSLSQLSRSPLSGTGAEWVFERGRQRGTVRALFYPRGRAAWTAAQEKAKAIKTDPADREQLYFQQAKRRMQGLSLKWTLDLPGDVLSCSANTRKTDDRQITATVSADDIETPQDLVLLLAPRFEVVFDGRACTFPLD